MDLGQIKSYKKLITEPTFASKELVIASTFLSLQNWTPYIPSAATVKQIALTELYS
jgi:hypothetical protein